MTRDDLKKALILNHGVISPDRYAAMIGINAGIARSIVAKAIKDKEIQGLGRGFRNHAPKAAKAEDLFVFRSSRA